MYSLMDIRILCQSLASSERTRKAPGLQHHNEGAGEQEQGADHAFPGEGLAEEDRGEDDGEDKAALVDRDDLGDLACLDGVEVTEPGRACGQSGQDEEQPAFRRDGSDAAGAVGEEDHSPGHNQDNYGSDGRRKVGVNAVQTDLGQNGCRRGEHRGQDSENPPHILRVSSHSQPPGSAGRKPL